MSRELDTIQHTLSSTGSVFCETINKYEEFGNEIIFQKGHLTPPMG